MNTCSSKESLEKNHLVALTARMRIEGTRSDPTQPSYLNPPINSLQRFVINH